MLAQQFAEPPEQMARVPNLEQQALAFGPIVDRVAVALQTLRHQPDQDLPREAREQLRGMIAANRAFWTEVATETGDATGNGSRTTVRRPPWTSGCRQAYGIMAIGPLRGRRGTSEADAGALLAVRAEI
nr:hypothetical protein [Paracoccus saliphilus]